MRKRMLNLVSDTYKCAQQEKRKISSLYDGLKNYREHKLVSLHELNRPRHRGSDSRFEGKRDTAPNTVLTSAP